MSGTLVLIRSRGETLVTESASVPGPQCSALDEVPHCARVTAAMLRDFGSNELADSVDRYADRPSSERPTVVVVGETKRGKSSLVNALLGRPGLSPVDDDVATCVHVKFGYSATTQARVFVSGAAASIDIDVADLDEWACEQNNPCNVKGVTAIEVGLPVPLLRHLTLVDTPGVGGLELGHGELTLQALGSADAVVFVVDAGAPISRTELTFLVRAAERIDTVALVLTKIDAYPEWRRIQQEDLDLLRTHAPRFATSVMPFSSVNAERALALGDTPDGRLGRRESGLENLENNLVSYIANRAHLLWGANTMRFCLQGIAELRGSANEQVSVADADPLFEKEIVAEQERLTALTPADAMWRAQLNASIFKLKNDRIHDFATRLDELKARYDALAQKRKHKQELQQLAAQFTAAVDAMGIEIANETATKLVTDVAGVIDALADDANLRASLSEIALVTVAPGAQYAPSDQRRMTGIELYTHVMPMFGIERILTLLPMGKALTVLGIHSPAAPVILPMAIAGAAVLKINQQKTKIAQVNNFIAWTRDYVIAARGKDSHAFGDAMNTAGLQLIQALDAGIKRRVVELSTARRHFEDRVNETAAQRAVAVKAAHERLARVDALNGRVQAVLSSVQTQRASTPPPTEPLAPAAPR